MAKFETIFCAVTWGLMNALFVAVAVGSATPVERVQIAPVASAPVA